MSSGFQGKKVSNKKILIVDDENMARQRMLRFLEKFPEKMEIYEASNGPEALQLIKEKKPDIVFLDIQMPEMSGFDLLYNLSERQFQVVFQTAYDEFAIKAFEVNACDYILKPYSEEKFCLALRKALLAYSQQAQLRQLEAHLKASKNYINTVIAKVANQTKVITLDEVVYFKSEDHYTFAVTSKNEFIIDLSLNALEEKLNPEAFSRSHRNCIVKIAEIESIGASDSSSIKLKTGIEAPVSRENRKKFLKLFQQK